MKSRLTYLKVAFASVFLAGAMANVLAAEVGMPSQIPHDISAYQITPEMNACLMCHKQENSMAGAANISASHYTDDGKLNQVQYICTVCHTPAEAK